MTLTNPKRYTVTAALIYANGPIHIGHLAGCYLPADIYARYLRSIGEDVIFVSGTDEHGVPITIKAKKEGITPQQVVDKYYVQIKDSFEQFGISFDIYSRTSNPTHHKESQDFFKKLYDKGSFIEETTDQYYDEKAQQFLSDRYIVGTCPVCSNENAYGDQCERCGSTLSPLELKNPRSVLSGEKPVLKKTKNWYLPLDKMQPEIEAFVNLHPEWKSNVIGQCQSWLKQGLQPRAMTRDLEWGVKVPLDDAEGKVLYVWFDAPIGYITFTRELFDILDGATKNQSQEVKSIYPHLSSIKSNSWENYWKDDQTKLVHFIGKDNIVFHCIIFPAMMQAEGSYIMPDNVPANEFMNLEGEKISTSRNWAVWLHEYLEEFPDKQDVLRYTLCANAPETKDNDFTWKDFQLRNNSELVSILGNFVNRTLVLTQKYYHQEVPNPGALPQEFDVLLEAVSGYKQRIGAAIKSFKFRDALFELIDLARTGNKFLQENEPWKLVKDESNSEKVKQMMYVSIQICANLAIEMAPFMPFTATKLGIMMNFALTKIPSIVVLHPGHKMNEPELLFDKIEDDIIAKQVAKLAASKEAITSASLTIKEAKQAVAFDEFVKMDIRIATILEAEKVAKTQKLLKIKLDTGLDIRTVVSGIAEHYSPEEIIGMQVCILANLAPREIKGITSQGMILMAEDKDGKLSFVSSINVKTNGSIVA